MEIANNAINDTYELYDRLKIKEKNTSYSEPFNSIVIIRNKHTKQILYVGKNRSMLTAAEFFARKAFEPVTRTVINTTTGTDTGSKYILEHAKDEGNSNPWRYLTETYDNKLNLVKDQDAKSDTFNDLEYKVCLFCIGTSGANSGSGTKNATYRNGWIRPDDLVPFRQVDSNSASSVPKDLYFGKKSLGSSYIAYYFKKIDTNTSSGSSNSSSNINIRKIDQGTENQSWFDDPYTNFTASNINSKPQVIVSCNMVVDENDGRAYFSINTNRVSGSPRFNCLSLCLATPCYNKDNEIVDYANIRCFTRINFLDKDLSDSSAYEITYNIYF